MPLPETSDNLTIEEMAWVEGSNDDPYRWRDDRDRYREALELIVLERDGIETEDARRLTRYINGVLGGGRP